MTVVGANSGGQLVTWTAAAGAVTLNLGVDQAPASVGVRALNATASARSSGALNGSVLTWAGAAFTLAAA